MKKTYNLLFIISIFCHTMPIIKSTTKKPYSAPSSIKGGVYPELIERKNKPIIITDYDDVWNMKTFFLNLLITFQSSDNKPHKLGNLTLNILDYGRRYPIVAPYIPWVIEYIGKARYINQPIHDLYKYLKTEGYTIDIATNKDHLLYDLCIEALGNEIPSMVDTVFVAEPQSDATAIAQLQAFAAQPTTTVNYKNMAQKAINIKETNNIIHVPSKKPATEYYNYVIQHVGADNDMIFIDDNTENVDAFNALQKDTQYLRLGIRYDESNLNQFAEDLKKAGLVSEEKNQALLDEIRYPGITGKIKQNFNYIFAR